MVVVWSLAVRCQRFFLIDVVNQSLHSSVLVKKDSPSEGVLDSCQVLGSTVPAVGSHLDHLWVARVSARGLVNRLYFYRRIGVELVGLSSSTVLAAGLGYL